MKRNLTLRRETLSELSDADLGVVAGAQADPSIGSCPILNCIPRGISRDQFMTCGCQTEANC